MLPQSDNCVRQINAISCIIFSVAIRLESFLFVHATLYNTFPLCIRCTILSKVLLFTLTLIHLWHEVQYLNDSVLHLLSEPYKSLFTGRPQITLRTLTIDSENTL
jgi:hypothetical protein